VRTRFCPPSPSPELEFEDTSAHFGPNFGESSNIPPDGFPSPAID
jgi:hypothetical protein